MATQANIFCKRKDLRNEATVESLFIDRLLNFLKYPDDKVLRKESIEEKTIGRGSKSEKYKPDYILLDSSNTPKVIIDAKSPEVDIEDYLYQVSSYALSVNQEFSDNPVLYTILTNGNIFSVYPWDSNRPVFFLEFDNFQDQEEKFLELRSNLAYSAFNQAKATKDVFEYNRPSINKLIQEFNNCHDLIWKKEKVGPTDAFYEFAKIMFIKIKEDNKIHDIIDSGKKPTIDDFIFSTRWIDKQKKVQPNPVDSILFSQIQKDLEKQIRENKKKRIFEKDEGLNLKASTIYEVVKKLQHFDLYGIDEDLNGRMFETFLNATVRGKALGQFFTPRGVVHYMVETAPIHIKTDEAIPFEERMPYVLDACCGSGGFLIDAMAQYTHKLNNISSLTNKQREEYLTEIKNNHLYGIEANSKITRISRLNMYLHGDGGSKIFKADSLDKEIFIEDGIKEEEEEGMKELQTYLQDEEVKFDIVLTNPPFSMKYKKSDQNEKRILKQYEIARTTAGSLSASEKSNVLFIERYKDLLKDNSGEILTIIDDTVLNGDNSQRYRDYILDNFIIKQIISLPFNTFFRADANIKTTMIHLRRKKEGEEQGNIFMAITNNVGHDDHSRDTPDRNNMPTVAKFYQRWKEGQEIEDTVIDNAHPDEPLGCPLQIFEVTPDRLNERRLDAFYYSPELNQIRKTFTKLEKEGKIQLRTGSSFNLIPDIKGKDEKNYEGKIYKYFEIGDVTIDGTITKHIENYFEKLPTRARLQVENNDVIFAKNNSSRGTTVLIPEWFDKQLVTTGFIGIRPESYEDALLIWSAMESEIFRKQVYYLAVTASQPEVRDSIFKEEMFIPWPDDEESKKRIIKNAQKVVESRKQLRESLQNTTSSFEGLLKL